MFIQMKHKLARNIRDAKVKCFHESYLPFLKLQFWKDPVSLFFSLGCKARGDEKNRNDSTKRSRFALSIPRHKGEIKHSVFRFSGGYLTFDGGGLVLIN